MTSMRVRLLRYAIVIALVGFGVWFTAFRSNDPKYEKPAPNDPLVFPLQDPSDSVMEALFEGQLVRRGTCLALIDPSYDARFTPVWPHNFSFGRVGEDVVILNGEGDVLMRTGMQISMGGGLTGEGPGSRVPREIARRAEGCPRPYWIVGEVFDQV